MAACNSLSGLLLLREAASVQPDRAESGGIREQGKYPARKAMIDGPLMMSAVTTNPSWALGRGHTVSNLIRKLKLFVCKSDYYRQ